MDSYGWGISNYISNIISSDMSGIPIFLPGSPSPPFTIQQHQTSDGGLGGSGVERGTDLANDAMIGN